MAKPIYVETEIAAEIEDLWEATQDPKQHEQWDLRFSEIHYLPKENDEAPQRFLYKTRIGFGLSIAGEGETVGYHEKNTGERTSALKFWSDQPISLIRTGSGYWKYIPQDDGVTFLTRYDYQTRFGRCGKWFDQLLFRPLMGWATAWSFDCLRIWLEKGIPPQLSVKRSLIHLLTVVLLMVMWAYQGLVPKIMFQDSGELEFIRAIPLFAGVETTVLTAIGLFEIAFALLFLFFHRRKWLFGLNIWLILILTAGALTTNPLVFVEPFNPVTLNLLAIGVSVIGLLSLEHLPHARRCKRTHQPEKGGDPAVNL
jgi:hypothetical protein